MIPIIFAGILGIYGIVMSVMLNARMGGEAIVSAREGYKVLTAGLLVGFSNLAAGYAVAYVGQESVKDGVGHVIELCFAEALGLYGLIVGIIVST